MKRWMACTAALLVTLSSGQSAGLRSGGKPVYNHQPDMTLSTTAIDYKRLFKGLRTSIENLTKTVGTHDEATTKFLQEIGASAGFLEVKWEEWFKNNRSPKYEGNDPYYRSLSNNLRLLKDAEKEKDAKKVMSVVQDVALDIQIKADNCRHSTDGLGKEIKVKVRTKSGGQEAGGYEVCFVPKGMLDVERAHDRFSKQSSPTDEKILSPGGYAIWVRKKDFKSQPVTMKIGGHGETKLELELEVP